MSCADESVEPIYFLQRLLQLDHLHQQELSLHSHRLYLPLPESMIT
jgi:hypothetical protein